MVADILRRGYLDPDNPREALIWLLVMGGPEAARGEAESLRATLARAERDSSIRQLPLRLAAITLALHALIGQQAVDRVERDSNGTLVWTGSGVEVKMWKRGQQPSLLTFLVYDWCVDQQPEAHLFSNTASNRSQCADALRGLIPDDDLDASSRGRIWQAMESYRRYGSRHIGRA